VAAATVSRRGRSRVKPINRLPAHPRRGPRNEWTTGTQSTDYVGYRAMIEKTRQRRLRRVCAPAAPRSSATPEEITTTLLDYHAACGGFEFASVQFCFTGIDPRIARESLELFAAEVMPKLK